MVTGIILLLKGVILTEGLTAAARSWGIFDEPRRRVKKSPFFRRLLDCCECTSVWAAGFVVPYLLYFELPILSYILISARLALYMHTIYDWLDACRAVKEGQL
jgi:hypothetical protein